LNSDTSLKRIALISIICVLALPYVFQLFMNRGPLFPDGGVIESHEIFTELKGFQRLITQHLGSTGDWPDSLSAIAMGLSSSTRQSVDLSVPYQLTSTISQQTDTVELRGQVVVFRLDFSWQCVPELTTLPDTLKPTYCGGQLTALTRSVPDQGFFLMVAYLALIAIVIAVVFYHPVLRTLRKADFKLVNQRLTDLPKLARLIQWGGLKSQVITANELNPKAWKKIISFGRADERQKLNWMCRTLPVKQLQKTNRSVHLMQLDGDFPLNIDALYWYTASATTSISRINNHLRQLSEDQIPVVIWAENTEMNQLLQVNHSRIKARHLIPNQQQMTRMLVPNLARQCLLDLLTTHIPINLLSPFQGKGGVIKASQFYGRDHILTQLQNNPSKCFLLVGGRQLGKTSILKAYARILQRSPHKTSCYISMSDHRLLPRLGYQLNISRYRDLTDMLTQYHQQNPGRQLVILLDETDRFISTEAKNDFRLMAEIRSCAEQGLGQMVFAGFWDLYASAVLDYHSPLKNFADILTVGALEEVPAGKLITEPMQLLNQRFSDDQVVPALLAQTGQRANLINLAAAYLVEQLAQQPQIINANLVQQALRSQPLFDAMQGWNNLSSDPLDSALDRILVYLTFIHCFIDVSMVLDHLEQAGKRVESERLKQAFHRLRLAHILTHQNQQYQFAVPLFATQHSPAEANNLLRQELLSLPA